MLHALIIDDDDAARESLRELVEGEGFECSTAETLEEARRKVEELHPDVVLCDLVLPDGKGSELLEEVASRPGTDIILVTGHASTDTAVEALQLGAYDFLTKPIDVPRLKTLLANVAQTRQLREELSELRGELRELGRFDGMVGTSAPMRRVFDLIERVAETDATVLVVGESGTGKELVARTIHRLSRRRKGPFLPLNCGAVSPSLIESELFGHERGAFTGASRRHRGYFERASGGTLLLDEITEMPPALQVKLLRVLETRRLTRVGGNKEIAFDARVLAATNLDPEQAVEDGKLREDLFYRLKVFPIHLPPLRQREGDVELLAAHFLGELNQENGSDKRFTDGAMERLERHSWPGNVRELENAVRRAYILTDGDITPDTLPVPAAAGHAVDGPYLRIRVGTPTREAERRLILATLDETGGNKTQAAKTLGISVKTLYNRLKRYEEEKEEKERVAG